MKVNRTLQRCYSIAVFFNNNVSRSPFQSVHILKHMPIGRNEYTQLNRERHCKKIVLLGGGLFYLLRERFQ